MYVQSHLVPLTILGAKFSTRLHVLCVVNSLHNYTCGALVVPCGIPDVVHIVVCISTVSITVISYTPTPSPSLYYSLTHPSPPRPYDTRSHMNTGPLAITLQLVCERILSPQTLTLRLSFTDIFYLPPLLVLTLSVIRNSINNEIDTDSSSTFSRTTHCVSLYLKTEIPLPPLPHVPLSNIHTGVSVIPTDTPVCLLSRDWCIIVYLKTEIPLTSPLPPLPHVSHSHVVINKENTNREDENPWLCTRSRRRTSDPEMSQNSYGLSTPPVEIVWNPTALVHSSWDCWSDQRITWGIWWVSIFFHCLFDSP